MYEQIPKYSIINAQYHKWKTKHGHKIQLLKQNIDIELMALISLNRTTD